MSHPVISDSIVQKIRSLEREVNAVQEFTDADLGDNIIYNYHITTGAVTSNSIADATITGGDIASATIVAGNIANATITATQIANATITGTQIAAGTIVGTNIGTATITSTNIQDATIQGADIASATIAGGNIATGTITSTNIQDATITGADIGSATVTGTNIGTGTITSTNIQDATIAAADIANATITATQIANLTITAAQIANATITGTQINAAAITSSHIVDLTIVAGDIANTTITGGKIGSATITGGNIASGTITSGNILDATITGGDIANTTITAGNITALTITSAEIADLTITGAKIAAATITANKITVTNLSALSADLGTITAGTITGATFQTSASNPRVYMDATGVGAVGSTGITNFKLDASTGKLTTLAGVGGGNIIQNSSFEDTNAMRFWTTGGGNAPTRDTTEKFHGTASARINNPSAVDSYFYQDLTLQKIGTWKITAWIKTDSVAGTGNGAKVNVDQVSGSITTTDSIAQLGWNDWTRHEATAVVNTAGSVLRVYCQLGFSGTVTGTAWFDGVQAEYADFATAYAPKPDELRTDSVTNTEIAPTTVTAAEIANGTITTTQIAATTILAGNIAANTITAAQIAAATITGTQIAATTITATNIAASTITSAQIAANTITAGQIAADTITSNEIFGNTLSAITADLGTINAGVLTGVTITGSTVQTSTTGPRVVMDTSGLTAYGVDDSPVLALPTSGDSMFKGAVDAEGGVQFIAPITSPPPEGNKAIWQDANQSEIASVFGITTTYPGSATQSLIASATGPLSYPNLIKAHANLKHYWKLDWNGGSTTPDAVATSPLTLTAIITPSTNPALVAGGTGAFAIRTATSGRGWFSASPASNENVTTGLSIEYWIKFIALPDRDLRIVTRSAAADGSSSEYWKSTYITSTNKLQVSLLIGGVARTQTTASTITANTLYHVVHTYDGVNIRTYLNSVENGAATAQTGSIDAQNLIAYNVGLINTVVQSSAVSSGSATTQFTQLQSDSTPGPDWVNPGNALALDSSYATVSLGAITNHRSKWLAVTGFGFNVPTGATVTGVEVQIDAHASVDPAVKVGGIMVVYNGAQIGSTGGTLGSYWQTTDRLETYGGQGELFFTGSLTPTQVNSSTFGISFYAVNLTSTSKTASVDRVRVKVYYRTDVILDETATYNAALSQAVISDHYQTGTTGVSTSVTSVEKKMISADGTSDYTLKGEGFFQPLWASSGTNTTTGGAAAELIENGVEQYDPGNNGTALTFTVPVSGLYRVEGWFQLLNSNADAELIANLTVNGASSDRLFRADQPGGAGGDTAGSGFTIKSLALNDVISANVQHFDGVNVRSIAWRMFITRLRSS